MNAQHEMAMQLLGACLIINDLGKYHAHYDYGPHTNAVYVHVASADAAYDGTDQTYLANLTVYLAWDSAEQDCAAAIERLREFMK